MIISDLSYLQVVSVPSIVGGAKRKNNRVNNVTVTQSSSTVATVTINTVGNLGGGDVSLTINSSNTADVTPSNDNL